MIRSSGAVAVLVTNPASPPEIVSRAHLQKWPQSAEHRWGGSTAAAHCGSGLSVIPILGAAAAAVGGGGVESAAATVGVAGASPATAGLQLLGLTPSSRPIAPSRPSNTAASSAAVIARRWLGAAAASGEAGPARRRSAIASSQRTAARRRSRYHARTHPGPCLPAPSVATADPSASTTAAVVMQYSEYGYLKYFKINFC